VMRGIISHRGYQASLPLYLHALVCLPMAKTHMMVSVIDIETSIPIFLTTIV
jgi:hypothetical protein